MLCSKNFKRLLQFIQKLIGDVMIGNFVVKGEGILADILRNMLFSTKNKQTNCICSLGDLIKYVSDKVMKFFEKKRQWTFNSPLAVLPLIVVLKII